MVCGLRDHSGPADGQRQNVIVAFVDPVDRHRASERPRFVRDDLALDLDLSAGGDGERTHLLRTEAGIDPSAGDKAEHPDRLRRAVLDEELNRDWLLATLPPEVPVRVARGERQARRLSLGGVAPRG
jgi:hypothetical protein